MKDLLYKGRFFFIPLGIVAFLSLISFIVMALWNNLLPEIMNVGVITFWQAMGIFILCKILFGFGRGGHRAGPWKHRCGPMNQEQKEKFKAALKARMCNWQEERLGAKDYESDKNNS